jgi:hypothetical protein
MAKKKPEPEVWSAERRAMSPAVDMPPDAVWPEQASGPDDHDDQSNQGQPYNDTDN